MSRDYFKSKDGLTPRQQRHAAGRANKRPHKYQPKAMLLDRETFDARHSGSDWIPLASGGYMRRRTQ